MRTQYIELYSYKLEKISLVDYDRWTYTRKNWFTDKLWKLLMNLGCLNNPVDSTDTYKRIIINTDSVAKAVLTAMDGLYLRNRRPRKVYMGPDEFDKHLSDRDYHRDNAYNFSITLNENSHTMYDLPVEVVPHMKGLLVV